MLAINATHIQRDKKHIHTALVLLLLHSELNKHVKVKHLTAAADQVTPPPPAPPLPLLLSLLLLPVT